MWEYSVVDLRRELLLLEARQLRKAVLWLSKRAKRLEAEEGELERFSLQSLWR